MACFHGAASTYRGKFFVLFGAGLGICFSQTRASHNKHHGFGRERPTFGDETISTVMRSILWTSMSRVHLASDTCHIYFIHTKVNHLLYTCPLVPFEDGILLDPSLVCIHRCERSYTFIEEESKKKRTSTPSKREAWKQRRKRQEEGSNSQATPRARAPLTPCPRASQAGGP